MEMFFRYLSSKSKRFHVIVGFVIVLCLDVPVYFLGPNVSVSVFYLFPILLTTWFAGRWGGIVVACFSALTWLAVELLAALTHAGTLIPYWNAAVRFGFFIIVLLLLDAFRREKISARRDYLTGLGNRRQFFETAGTELDRFRRYGHPVTVAYIDVDDFKKVNDLHGHSAGDALLKSIASSIRKNIRTTDAAARLGGDEFALLLPETDAAQAEQVVGKIHRRLQATVKAGPWDVTFSVGVVTFTKPPSSTDALIKAVDGLMYEAKRQGKNLTKFDVFS